MPPQASAHKMESYQPSRTRTPISRTLACLLDGRLKSTCLKCRQDPCHLKPQGRSTAIKQAQSLPCETSRIVMGAQLEAPGNTPSMLAGFLAHGHGCLLTIDSQSARLTSDPFFCEKGAFRIRMHALSSKDMPYSRLWRGPQVRKTMTPGLKKQVNDHSWPRIGYSTKWATQSRKKGRARGGAALWRGYVNGCRRGDGHSLCGWRGDAGTAHVAGAGMRARSMPGARSGACQPGARHPS